MHAADDANGSGRSESLKRSLCNSGVTVLCCGHDFKVVWAENVPHSWSGAPVEGRHIRDFLASAAAEALIEAARNAVAASASQNLDIKVPAAEGGSWFSIWVDCDRSTEGEVVGVVTTAVDITEQKRREQTLGTLLREVSHRSKNLLAIIQSIATQTGHHSGTIEMFLLRFRGRLQSLASTQDLVTSSNWRGAGLRELVIGQLSRYVAKPERSVHLHGEHPYLNPNAALHIGLAIHELAVNSVSYGALSSPDGLVNIAVSKGDPDSPDILALEWSELIDGRDRNVGRKRFGSTALERVVPASLNGSAVLDIGEDKLTYRLLIPAGNFEIDQL